MTTPEDPAAADSASAGHDPGAAYDAMKAKEERRSYLRREGAAGNTEGWTATGTILSGIIVYALIGWGLSAWTGWKGFLPIGVLLGAGLGVYMVTKQAANPPGIMDISKEQDGGVARRARLEQMTSRKRKRDAEDSDPDEGHTT